MQFDFLKKLLARAPVVKAPPPAANPLEELARNLLLELGCLELAARVRVRWNPRMRSTAGTALASKSLVTLNPRLHEFGAEEVERTLRHELAHLLAHHRAGRRRISPHGPEWQQACRDLGLTDEKRCHELPLPRRKMQARHKYRCAHCAVEIQRVRPMRRASACLSCCRKYNRGRYDARYRFVRVAA